MAGVRGISQALVHGVQRAIIFEESSGIEGNGSIKGKASTGFGDKAMSWGHQSQTPSIFVPRP